MKTKKQLRTEAIERLKLLQANDGIECNNFAHEIVKAATCAHYSYDNAIDVLIDLLTDDDSNATDTFAPNKVVSCDADTSNDNDLDLEPDLREKLEEDACNFVQRASVGDVTCAELFGLLDRQASLTERKWTEYLADATMQIDRLEKERDELYFSLKNCKGELKKQVNFKSCDVPTDPGEAGLASVEGFIREQKGLDDTPEKLASDIRAYMHTLWVKFSIKEQYYDLERKVFEWLARQEKITRLKCFDGGVFYDGAKHRADMQAKIDALEAENSELNEELNRRTRRETYLQARLNELQEQMNERENHNDKRLTILRKQNDALQERCDNQQNELRRFNEIYNQYQVFATDDGNEYGCIATYYSQLCKANKREKSLREYCSELKRERDELQEKCDLLMAGAK